MSRKNDAWKMLLIALALILLGMFLMSESLNMLFEMNPFTLVAIALGALFIFSGIALIVISLAAIAVA